MSVEKKKYIFWVDFIRVAGIFGVVLIHVSSPLYNRWKTMAFADWMVGNVYNSIARVSVPLLFMLSGYLLLNRQEDLRAFYVNRVWKVALPFLVWSALYLVWKNGYADFTLFNAIKAIIYVVLTKPAYYHFWFLYALLPIYLFVPILRRFVHSADEQTLWYFALFWFVFGPLLDFIQQTVLNFNIAISLGFFTEYIGYFFWGYMLGRMHPPRWVATVAALSFITLTVFTIHATYRLSAEHGFYFDFYHIYTRLNIALMAFSAFVGLKTLGEKIGARANPTATRWMRQIAGTTFGVYLLHAMTLAMIRRGAFGFQLTALSASPIIMIPALAALVFILSSVIIALLQKIPYLRAIAPS